MNRLIAIVSGKGGSGKTMVSASIAQILSSELGVKTALIDADLGTGGLSYYLGLKLVRGIRPGVADLIGINSELAVGSGISRTTVSFQHVETDDTGFQWASVDFLPIGDHRRLLDESSQKGLPERLAKMLTRVGEFSGASYTIIDCRGGVDEETLAVCGAVHDIILVTEADTTSFQASRHLVESLVDRGLASKLRGFIVNKVFEDPTVFARTGSSSFGTRYLGSIPFDIRATRSFLIGDLPKGATTFINQLSWCLFRAFPDKPKPHVAEWTPKQFAEVALKDSDAERGGRVMLILTTLLLAVYVIRDFVVYRGNLRLQILIQVSSIGLLFLASSLDPVRKSAWRLIRGYRHIFSLFLPPRRGATMFDSSTHRDR